MVDCDRLTTDLLTFKIYLPHAGRVEVVGTFTDWEERPIAMNRGERDEAGWWFANVRVPAGEHEFSYLVDGQFWMPDYAATGVHRNQFGHWTSDLSVAAA
ncbi:MAG: glycogen-binding domain-containing protein [Phycisphaerales bacterium]|nr:glycogen-binding domain-containing protein [Phycisphaerales bacterium]